MTFFNTTRDSFANASILLYIICVGVFLLLFNIAKGASTDITSNTTWSAASIPSSNTVNIYNGAIVTVDVTTAVCAGVKLGKNNNGVGTLAFNAGTTLTVNGDVTFGNGNHAGSVDMTNGG